MKVNNDALEQDKLLKLVERMNLMDDEFFGKVAEDVGACEEILQAIENDEKLKLKYVEPQKFLRNLGNRSVQIDVLCTAVDNRRFGIEIQK